MNYTGTAGNDTITGTSGDDLFTMTQGGTDTVAGGAGDDIFSFGAAFNIHDVVDGGAGVDTLKLNGDYSGAHQLVFGSSTIENLDKIVLSAGHSYSIQTSEGNLGDGDTLAVSAATLGANDVLIFSGSTEAEGHFTITGGAGNDTLTGGLKNDSLHGGAGNDFMIIAGGHDTVDGGDGNDSLNIENGTASMTGDGGDDAAFLAAPFSTSDTFDGGSGSDTLVFETGVGNLTATFTAKTMVNVETLNFENDGNVNVRMNDANVAAGETLFVRADALAAGSSFKFNGSAETDGAYSVLGGNGANTITGGAGDDTINLSNGGVKTGGATNVVQAGAGDDYISIGNVFTANDRIDGGTGNDTVDFRLDSATTIHFANTTFTHVGTLFVDTTAADDSFISADGNVAAGQAMTVEYVGVQGTVNGNAESFKFDGSAETDGAFHFIGSDGADTLIGGAGADSFYGGAGQDSMTGNTGNDVFVYAGASESTGIGRDIITGFDADHDQFDLLTNVSGINASITSGKLSSSTFDTDLATALNATHLAANHAVIFTPDSGNFHGHTFLVIDANGVAGYQAGADYVVELVTPQHLADLAAGNFT